MLNISAEKFRYLFCPSLFIQHPADDKSWLEETMAVHTEKGTSFTVDLRMTHRQGHELWVRAINSVELDEENKPIMHGLILDITEQKTSEDRIV